MDPEDSAPEKPADPPHQLASDDYNGPGLGGLMRRLSAEQLAGTEDTGIGWRPPDERSRTRRVVVPLAVLVALAVVVAVLILVLR
jgi:hypothetical protein